MEHGPNYTNPPPELVNREEEWEVENILAHTQGEQGMLPVMHSV